MSAFLRRAAWAVVVGVGLAACPPVDHLVGLDDGGNDDGGGAQGGDGGAGGGGVSAETVSLTLIVDLRDTDAGVIISNQPGVTCSGRCTFTVPRGLQVHLGAQIGPRPTITSWSGGCSGFTQFCDVTLDASTTITASVRPFNHLFMTPGQYLPSDLGDHDGGVGLAEVLCQQTARELGLEGPIVPWLSTSKKNAIERIPAGVRGWVFEVNQYDVRAFTDDLGGGWILSPIALITSQPRFGTPATATDDFGHYLGPSCGDWTNTNATDQYRVGYLGNMSIPGWSSGTTIDPNTCDTPSNILCAQVRYDSPIPMTPIPGLPVAFVTAGQYPSGGGLEAFHQACAAEARDAGLSGTFRAAVETANSAWPLSPNAKWSRLDGVVVGANQVTADRRMVVPASVSGWPASDKLIVGDSAIWANGCVDFLSAQPFSSGGVIPAEHPFLYGYLDIQLTQRPCDQPARLWCYQTPQ